MHGRVATNTRPASHTHTHTPGRVSVMCRYEIKHTPSDVMEKPPEIFKLVTSVAKDIFLLPSIDGVQFGTACRHTQPVSGASFAKLTTWTNSHRAGYTTETIDAEHSYPVSSHGSPKDRSYFLCYYLLVQGVLMLD